MEENRIPGSPGLREETGDSQLNNEESLLPERDNDAGGGFYVPEDSLFTEEDDEDGLFSDYAFEDDEPLFSEEEEDPEDEWTEPEESVDPAAGNGTAQDRKTTSDQMTNSDQMADSDQMPGSGQVTTSDRKTDSATASEKGGKTDQEELPAEKKAGSDFSAAGSDFSAAGTASDGSGPETEKRSGGKTGDGKSAGQGTASPADSGEKGVENTLARVQAAPGDKKSKKKSGATYHEKILRHKQRQYRRTVLLVLLVMFVLTAGILLWMFRGYRSAELRRVATLSAEDGAAYANLNGNVVQYGGSGAICIDPRGDTLWTVSYEMQRPIVSVSGNVIAIANRGGYYVYTMDTDGLMGTIHTMLPIQNIAAAENGEVAVIMSDSRTTWVRLYTAKGKEIAYLVRTMAETGYPIAAAISPDGETLCLSSLQISNATVKSNVSFYNFGKAGQKVNDHLVDYSDFIDETVPYVRYLDNSTCVGVSDKRLILFHKTLLHSSGSTNILFSENVQGVFASESFIGLLFTNTTGESQYRLDIYNRRGKKKGSISFSMQFNNISIAGDKVYMNNEHKVQIYSLGGRCLYDGEFTGQIRALIPGGRLNDLLAVTGSEVDSVRLH